MHESCFSKYVEFKLIFDFFTVAVHQLFLHFVLFVGDATEDSCSGMEGLRFP